MKFPQTNKPHKQTMTIRASSVQGERLVNLIETKYQGILEITDQMTSFAIYTSNRGCVFVSMVSSSAAAKLIFNKLKKVSESIIARSVNAVWYAVDIIKVPWPPGEEAISQIDYHAYKYAKDIIKGPWPPGEPAIKAGRVAIKDIYEVEVLKPAGADWTNK